MLKLDIKKLPDLEIRRIVAERCAVHGDVRDVIICDPTPLVDYKLAFVRMADPGCIKRLVKAFAAISVNSAAVIRLDPLQWIMDANGMLARR